MVGAVRGWFIGTVAVRVRTGIGNDKDRTMWPSTRSNGPGVVCHRIRVDSEGKVAAVEDVEAERTLQQTSQRLGPCRRRAHARACLRLALLKACFQLTRARPAKTKNNGKRAFTVAYNSPLSFFISFIIIICIHFHPCSCSYSYSTMAAQSLRSDPPSTHHQHVRLVTRHHSVRTFGNSARSSSNASPHCSSLSNATNFASLP
jgi:hypothetical protein